MLMFPVNPILGFPIVAFPTAIIARFLIANSPAYLQDVFVGLKSD